VCVFMFLFQLIQSTIFFHTIKNHSSLFFSIKYEAYSVFMQNQNDILNHRKLTFFILFSQRHTLGNSHSKTMEQEKNITSQKMSWKRIQLSHNQSDTTALFNFEIIDTETLRVTKLSTSEKEDSGSIFSNTITDENVKEWCGGELLAKTGLVDLLADVYYFFFFSFHTSLGSRCWGRINEHDFPHLLPFYT